MFSVFSNNRSRPNPHSLWKAREIQSLNATQKDSVAEGIAQLERLVWSPIMPGTLQGKYEFLSTLNHHRDVILAVSYADPSQKYEGPYLSYFIGYEIDPAEGIHDDEIEMLEDATGRSFQDILAEIPSGKIFYFEDYSRAPTEQARIENSLMFSVVMQYLKSEGIGFAGDLRENTSYRILNRYHADDVHIFLDELQRNYYARGEHCHSVVGYFKE